MKIFSIHGFGIGFYGASNFQQDGTYTTTIWLILAYFPIMPLSGAKVVCTQKGNIPPFRLLHFEPAPINWAQVRRVWLFTSALWFGEIQILLYSESADSGLIYLVAYPCFMALLVYLLRSNAKEKILFKPNIHPEPYQVLSQSILWLIAISFLAMIGLIFWAT